MFPVALIAHQGMSCRYRKWMLPNAFKTFLILRLPTAIPAQRYLVVTQLKAE